MSSVDQASDGGLGLAFLLSEIRDFRKGLEARDERINGSIDGLRSDVSTLSSALGRSQDHVSAIEGRVQALQTDVHAIRSDVDGIFSERHTEQLRRDTAWAGPVRVLKNLALIGAGIGGALAIITFGVPWITAFFVVVP